jgi:hypothetical protein
VKNSTSGRLFATWFVVLIGSENRFIWEPGLCFLISGGALYGAASWFAGTPYDWLSGICTWAFRLTAGLAVLLTILRIASSILRERNKDQRCTPDFPDSHNAPFTPFSSSAI